MSFCANRHHNKSCRGERPDRKGRRDASLALASRRVRKSTSGCLEGPKHPRVSRRSARPHVREEGEKKIKHYGAAGAAKHPAGGAMQSEDGGSAAASLGARFTSGQPVRGCTQCRYHGEVRCPRVASATDGRQAIRLGPAAPIEDVKSLPLVCRCAWRHVEGRQP